MNVYTTGWWFGTWLLFFQILGTHIFRGVGQPPSRQINNIICRGYPVAMSELQRVNHPFHTQLGYNGSLRD